MDKCVAWHMLHVAPLPLRTPFHGLRVKAWPAFGQRTGLDEDVSTIAVVVDPRVVRLKWSGQFRASRTSVSHSLSRIRGFEDVHSLRANAEYSDSTSHVLGQWRRIV